MRVYHRLIHIRDQKERHEEIPDHISSHPVFKLTTEFRLHVQRRSAPIDKTSVLKVDDQGMRIFGELASVLREKGSVVMIYLMACILERHFGKDAIDDIDAIRGDLSISDIIDGVTPSIHDSQEPGHEVDEVHEEQDEIEDESLLTEDETEPKSLSQVPHANVFHSSSSTFDGTSALQPLPIPSAFSLIKTTPNVFNTSSPFGGLTFCPSSSIPVSGGSVTPASEKPTSLPQASTAATISPPNVFGTSSLSFNGSTFTPTINASASAPTKSVFVSLNEQSNSSTTTLTKSAGMNPSPASLNAATRKSFFGGSGSFGPSIPDASLSSGAKQATTPSSLDPMAVPFAPKLSPSQINPSTASEETSTGTFFQRSSTPSPSPLSQNNNLSPVPTPPILSSTSLSSSSSAIATPQAPIRRTSTNTPILSKIDTNTSSISSNRPLATPTVPPPPPRPQLISLPATPTVGPPTKSILNFLSGKGNVATSNHEILSPLFVPSPTTSGPSESFFNRKSLLKSGSEHPSGLLLNINGKGKSLVKPDVDKQDLENRSVLFIRKSLVVKTCLRRWHRRLLERIAWIEACRQSEAYKDKIKYQRQSPVHVDKKRRISAGPGMVIKSPVKKRVRRRVSSDYCPPRTDEELAQRFKEVHSCSIPLPVALSTTLQRGGIVTLIIMLFPSHSRTTKSMNVGGPRARSFKSLRVM